MMKSTAKPIVILDTNEFVFGLVGNSFALREIDVIFNLNCSKHYLKDDKEARLKRKTKRELGLKNNKYLYIELILF